MILKEHFILMLLTVLLNTYDHSRMDAFYFLRLLSKHLALFSLHVQQRLIALSGASSFHYGVAIASDTDKLFISPSKNQVFN